MILSQPPAVTAPADGPASAELRTLVQADQAARQDLQKLSRLTEAEVKALKEQDRARRLRALQLLQEGKLVTGADFSNAALIFQHGEVAEDFLRAHELALLAWMEGRGNSLPAAAEDRFLMHVGSKQRFGTQFDLAGVVRPVAETGEAAVTDTLRADFMQPPLEIVKTQGMRGIAGAMDALFRRRKERTDPTWLAKAARRPEAAELAQLARDAAGDSRSHPALRVRALELYRNDQLAAPADYRHAAIVLLSTGAGDDLLLAHELAAIAATRGDRLARPLAARALDAFLASIGRSYSRESALRAKLDLK